MLVMTIMRFGSILCGSYPFHQKCNASCGLQSSMPSLRKSFSTLVVCFLVLTNYVVHGVVSLKKTALTFCLHATSAGLFEVSFSNGGVLLGVLDLPFLILSKLGIAAHLLEIWDKLQILFLIKLRSMFWIRVSKGDDAIDDIGWWSEPSNCLIRRAPVHHRLGVSWVSPPFGEFKFNINGSAKGKLGPTRCSGVLRNSNGFVLGLFFILLGMCDSNYAKLMVVLHTLRLFSASSYVPSPLSIESDSRIAFLWINCVDQRPWDTWHIFNEIDSPLSSLGNVSLTHIFREANLFADSLAKYGVEVSSLLFAWWRDHGVLSMLSSCYYDFCSNAAAIF
ncbi:Uncharacterized protein TCM_040819 [Theobroma cacao]|uniref:RNase H type-1 domain-containing protein n=1 Tax=Theobroma cacao TaxID=3641 RepID=A0A061GZC6_THECC|nr:Uncharacterized protein TCM_040819 [Theobroma cacao]